MDHAESFTGDVTDTSAVRGADRIYLLGALARYKFVDRYSALVTGVYLKQRCRFLIEFEQLTRTEIFGSCCLWLK
jgi:hypothetical protein